MTLHPNTAAAGATGFRREAAKRVTDVSLSAFGLLLLAPVFALIAVVIRLDDAGPVFYRQTRVGRGGRTFEINKFRSMTSRQSAGQSHLTIAGDPRITRIGTFLRRTKLDELPQLANVLLGDMSLVGPRPETPDLIVHYTPAQRALMLSVRPGMTDWASLILRDESALLAVASDPSKFYRERLMPLKHELCAHYVKDIDPLTDLRIILATVCAIALPAKRNPWIEPSLAGRVNVKRLYESEFAPR
jgi:lipopolysaccharide/colanic/teichoic acid biosynthesis glycosyltransferase